MLEYTKNDKEKSTVGREMMAHELIPEQQTVLSFWDKFLELQFKMLIQIGKCLKSQFCK